MRNSWLLILAVFLLMAGFMAAGCETEEVSPGLPLDNGEANSGDGTVEDNAAAGDEIDFEPLPPEEGWVDFGDFVKLVKSARWSGVSPTCHDGTSTTIYDYEGTETVNGIRTDKTTGSFTVNGEDVIYWTIWVADDGTVVKAEFDGEQADESFYGLLVLMAVPPLAPFAFPDPDFNSQFKRSLAGENVPGWNLLSFNRKTERVGGKAAYVCDVSFIHPAWDNQTASFTYGDFGTFKILLETYLAYSSSTMITESISFR